jgi:hypothetical protein
MSNYETQEDLADRYEMQEIWNHRQGVNDALKSLNASNFTVGEIIAIKDDVLTQYGYEKLFDDLFEQQPELGRVGLKKKVDSNRFGFYEYGTEWELVDIRKLKLR